VEVAKYQRQQKAWSSSLILDIFGRRNERMLLLKEKTSYPKTFFLSTETDDVTL
jgi:hypothetical protein